MIMELPLEKPTVQKGEKMRGTASIKLAYTAIVGLTPELWPGYFVDLHLQKGESLKLFGSWEKGERKKEALNLTPPKVNAVPDMDTEY